MSTLSDASIRPSVSVVIPTVGRPEIARAIRSARDQVGDIDVEVVVVNDSRDEHAVDDVDADAVVWTGGARRGGHARNLGVAASRGEHIAFLDDDDEWLPTKLRDQLELVAGSADPALCVVSGRHVHVREGRPGSSRPCPDLLIGQEEPVDAYLFRRRRPSIGRASMYTSTLLCPRALATRVPWREDLGRHQDWDWLVRLAEVDGVTFVHSPEVVTRIQTGSSQSISASADWAASMRWAEETLRDDAVLVDFLAAQTLRYALNARSLSGVVSIARTIAGRRRLPAPGPLAIGLAGIVPRARMERLMTRRGRLRRSPASRER